MAALAPGAPLLWDEAPGNLSYRFERGDKAAVEAAFAAAAHTVEIALVNNRLVVVPDRAARRDRQLRRRLGRIRPAADRAGRPLDPQPARECRLSRAARAHQGACARCRRRVRDQEFSLSRMGARAVGGASPRAAGPLGRRARRGFSHLRAGPRQCYPCPPRARCERSVSRARCRYGRQSRRLSLDQRTRQLDELAGQRDGRGLRHSRRVHGGIRRLYQHRADRRLSRRRQTRGQLPDRAPRRSRRAATRHRPDRTAPAQRDPPLSVSKRSRRQIDCGRFAANLDDIADAHRRRRLCRAAAGGGVARPAARSRDRLFSRNLARHAGRARRNPLRAGRAGGTGAGHAIERPGPRDELPADRRRSARLADQRLSALSRPIRER